LIYHFLHPPIALDYVLEYEHWILFLTALTDLPAEPLEHAIQQIEIIKKEHFVLVSFPFEKTAVLFQQSQTVAISSSSDGLLSTNRLQKLDGRFDLLPCSESAGWNKDVQLAKGFDEVVWQFSIPIGLAQGLH
jgi:hypothetical protein